jgi:hypothetical protein
MTQTKLKPPTSAELDRMIVQHWRPGIKDDCRRIGKWIKKKRPHWNAALQAEADNITAHLSKLLREIEAGKPTSIISCSYTALWNSVRILNIHIDKPHTERGKRFEDGPKQPRRHYLSQLIDNALQELESNASADAVLDHIEPHIQEIDQDDRTIWWVGKNGRERKTTFKGFRNLVSERRKRLSTNKTPNG